MKTYMNQTIQEARENFNMQVLKLKDLEHLKGKTIYWNCSAYRYNEPYKGIAIISEVNLEEDRPLWNVETIEGDDLKYAFVDECPDQPIAYSDSDRHVHFVLID